MKLSPAFHTEWALVWAKNYREFSETDELLTYTNVRGCVCEAQREFERHLSEVMNYGSHQPLY
ncbi:hypothetical protein [Synechococcus phage MA10]|uniref:Uncharacterized protein n=1 Tax=Synechococcus phage S-H34 TaxID=2718942 RepID=A0A6G8R6F4_9CAUD|nr:hypothetical protein PQC15_gp106 [Synechococcus phage S-H34]QIN96977.1 hypothetical protein [Synechococcus phage S-H34]